MPRAEVAKVVELREDAVKNPGHGMSELELVFDREDAADGDPRRLAAPRGPARAAGAPARAARAVRRAGRRGLPDDRVTLDEFGNRAAVRVVFLSTTLRERSIDHHRARYRKQLD